MVKYDIDEICLLLDLKTFQMMILLSHLSNNERQKPMMKGQKPSCLFDRWRKWAKKKKKKKKLVSDLPKDIFGFKSLSSVRDGEPGFS